MMRAQVQPDEAGPAPQWAPSIERGFTANTDLEGERGIGGREFRRPQALRNECFPDPM
jgi:hypothetical protein